VKRSTTVKPLSFHSKLERISDVAEYFAFSVPAKTSQALKTKGPVPVSVLLNGSTTFLVSLFPVGGGRHYLRVNVTARTAAKIKEGDRVHVEITVLDRSDVSIPKDLASALRSEGLTETFKAMSIGKQNHLIKGIDKAAKPETREKRIREVVEFAHQQREKKADR
jgi:hypothetical protein